MSKILTIDELTETLSINKNSVETRLKLIDEQIEIRMKELNDLNSFREVFLTLLENL